MGRRDILSKKEGGDTVGLERKSIIIRKLRDISNDSATGSLNWRK